MSADSWSVVVADGFLAATASGSGTQAFCAVALVPGAVAGPAAVDPPDGVAELHAAASASRASTAAPPAARGSARVVNPLVSIHRVSRERVPMSVGPGPLCVLDLGPHFAWCGRRGVPVRPTSGMLGPWP